MSAENVKINPTLVAISGPTAVFEASVKNTYSLIPIPPKEKIDKTDEIKKMYKNVKWFSVTPRENNIKIIDPNWKICIKCEIKKAFV